MEQEAGLFPDWMIRQLIRAGAIRNASFGKVGPASLDLRISDDLRRLESFIKTEATVRGVLDIFGAEVHELCDPFERAQGYIGRFLESFALPKTVGGEFTGRSALARCNVVIRGLVPRAHSFDRIDRGFTSDLGVQLLPKSFPIRLRLGDAVAQAFFFARRARLNREEVLAAQQEHALFWHKGEDRPLQPSELFVDQDGGVLLGADVSDTHVGWQARETDVVVDIRKRRFYYPMRFYRPPRCSREGVVVAQTGCSLLLYSSERVRLPLSLAATIARENRALGSYTTNDARLVQPGWGWGSSGEGRGRSLVFEIRLYGKSVFLIRDRQRVAKLYLERMAAPAARGYDALRQSHFTAEESLFAMLPPQFRRG